MSGKDWVRDADVISGTLLAALGAYICGQAWGWVYYGPDGPGPGFFPTWYGLAMIGLSLLLIAGKVGKNRLNGNGAINWGGAGRALGTWAVFTACALLLKPLGFGASFALLTFFVVKVVFRRSLRSALITAIATTIAFELTFPVALGVSLPAGPLGF